jgi:hypothetical protein
MAEPDLYALFAGDEPTAQEQAAALSQVLRRKQQQAAVNRGLGALTALGQNNLLTGLSQRAVQSAGAMEEGAAGDERMLAQAGGQRSNQRLQRALELERQRFQAGEHAKDRSMRLGLAGADLEKDAAGAQAKKASDLGKFTMDLRKEFTGLPEVKDFKNISVAYDKIRGAANNPSAAGDLSLIFSYMKLLDPGSTVREGEFANAQNATGVPGQIANQYNRLLKGERLSPDQRQDFLGQSRNLFGSHAKQYGSTVGRYRGLAEKGGVAPDDVAEAFEFSEEQEATPTRQEIRRVPSKDKKYFRVDYSDGTSEVVDAPGA